MILKVKMRNWELVFNGILANENGWMSSNPKQIARLEEAKVIANCLFYTNTTAVGLSGFFEIV